MKALLLLVASVLCLSGCHAPRDMYQPIDAPEHSGELVVLTRNDPATRFEGGGGEEAGFENDLVTLFAQQFGYRIRFIEMASVPKMLTLLNTHQAHLMATSLIPERNANYAFQLGPAYLSVIQEVIYNTDALKPSNIAGLLGLRVATVAKSWHVDALRAARLSVPGLHWNEVDNAWSEQLLDQLAHGGLDAVVVDSSTFDLVRHFYPNLDVAFDLTPSGALAWQFPRTNSPVLMMQVKKFFFQIQRDGRLKQLIDRYYGFADRLEDEDVSGFLQKMNSVLPKYRLLFDVAQQKYGIDWRLLAAVSYQESHWDPLATSPTGVRGMMMMTSDTADKMGIADRLNPLQSILGGAKYIDALLAQQSDDISPPDRIWMALAAYNQGQAHVDDARRLAARHHLNPSLWCDVKQTLPMLASITQADTSAHGYCRGGEAVIFVESIRTYYDILKKYEPTYLPPLMTDAMNFNQKIK